MNFTYGLVTFQGWTCFQKYSFTAYQIYNLEVTVQWLEFEHALCYHTVTLNSKTVTISVLAAEIQIFLVLEDYQLLIQIRVWSSSKAPASGSIRLLSLMWLIQLIRTTRSHGLVKTLPIQKGRLTLLVKLEMELFSVERRHRYIHWTAHLEHIISLACEILILKPT